MNRFLFTALFGCAIFSATNANADGPRHEPGQRAQRLKQELGLSDEQSNKLAQAFANRPRCRELTDESARKECRNGARGNIEKEMKDTLTPEQMQKFQKIREERMQKWKERRENGEGPGGEHHGGQK